MADPRSTAADDGPRPNIEEAFVADRERFWAGFVKFTTYAAAAIVLLLIVMRVTIV